MSELMHSQADSPRTLRKVAFCPPYELSRVNVTVTVSKSALFARDLKLQAQSEFARTSGSPAFHNSDIHFAFGNFLFFRARSKRAQWNLQNWPFPGKSYSKVKPCGCVAGKGLSHPVTQHSSDASVPPSCFLYDNNLQVSVVSKEPASSTISCS